MTKINGSSQPQALATPQTTAASAPAAPVTAKAAPMIGPEPPPPRDPFASDAFGQCGGPSAADLFMKQAAPRDAAPHPKLASASMPAMTAGQLAQQSAVSATEASKPKADPATQQLLNTMTSALANPKAFGEDDFKGGLLFGSSAPGLGLQLQESVYKNYSNNEASLVQGLKGLLNSPEQTKAAFSAALSHLPPAQRDAAASMILDRMGDKLCGILQRDIASQVRGQISDAQAKLAPMCGDLARDRILTMMGLATWTPPLSSDQIAERLQSVGMPPGDAKSIALDLSRNSDSAVFRQALIAGGKGDFTNNFWKSTTLIDGSVRNFDEKVQGAFEKMAKSLTQLDEKLSNERSRGDALFTNDLFKAARDDVFSKHGIVPRKEGGTPLDARIHAHIDRRQRHDRNDAIASGVVMAMASLAVPGAGAIAAVGVSAAGSAPGVLVAQSEMNAAHAGAFAGSNSNWTAAAYEGKRDAAVWLAVAGAVLSGLRYSDEAAETFKEVSALLAETAATEAVAQGVNKLVGSSY